MAGDGVRTDGEDGRAAGGGGSGVHREGRRHIMYSRHDGRLDALPPMPLQAQVPAEGALVTLRAC